MQDCERFQTALVARDLPWLGKRFVESFVAAGEAAVEADGAAIPRFVPGPAYEPEGST